MASLGLWQPDEESMSAGPSAALPTPAQYTRATGSPNQALTDLANQASPSVTPQQERIALLRQNVPQWESDPIGAIGFVLRSVAAGWEGKELPVEQALRAGRQAQAFKMQQLSFGVQALQSGLELSKKIPADQREAFTEVYGKKFEGFAPGFTEMFKAASKRGDVQAILPILGEHAAAFSAITGNDPDAMLKLASDKDFVALLDRRADEKNSSVVNAKLTAIMKATSEVVPPEVLDLFQRDEKGNLAITFADLTTLNSALPDKFKLSQSELGTLRRNPETLNQFGIVTPDVAAAKMKADAQRAPSETSRLLDEIDRETDPKRRQALEADLKKRTSDRSGDTEYTKLLDDLEEAERGGNTKRVEQIQKRLDKLSASGDKEAAPPELVKLQERRRALLTSDDPQAKQDADEITKRIQALTFESGMKSKQGQLLDEIEAAEKNGDLDRAKELRAQLAKQNEKPSDRPATESPLAKLQRERREAVERGDTFAADQLQAAIDKQVAPKVDKPSDFALAVRREGELSAKAERTPEEEQELTRWRGLLEKKTQGKPAPVRDQKIADYEKMGLSRSEAIDAADGNIVVTTDSAGRSFLVNKITGVKTQATSARAKQMREIGVNQPFAPDEIDPAIMEDLYRSVYDTGAVLRQADDAMRALQGADNESFFGRTAGAVGPQAIVESFLTSTLGNLPDWTMIGGKSATFPDTARNRQILRIFSEDVVAALVKNPRFPVAEQERIKKLAPDVDAWFTNPTTAALEMRELLRIVKNRNESDLAKIEGRDAKLVPPIPLGTETDPLRPATLEEAGKLPKGVYYIHPQNGRIRERR